MDIYIIRVNSSFEQELTEFRRSSSDPRLDEFFAVERPCTDMVVLQPRGIAPFAHDGKDIALAILGLVHGNEVAGVAILGSLLRQLASRTLQLRFKIAIGLGNVPAGSVGKRFVERDLNRSFLRDSKATHEDRRARELESVLRRTWRLLDIHQTREISQRPFFIFPYSREALTWARQISARHTVVTHWGKPFSGDGRCSDEFVNASGGVGITVELGRCGFDPAQISIGGDLATRAVAAMNQLAVGQQVLPSEPAGEIFTWGAVLPWPSPDAFLHPGLVNFAPVASGQEIGLYGTERILAPVAGLALFPKYLDKPLPGQTPDPPPAEICRILRPVREEELPTN